jgi:hypothetical protein
MTPTGMFLTVLRTLPLPLAVAGELFPLSDEERFERLIAELKKL